MWCVSRAVRKAARHPLHQQSLSVSRQLRDQRPGSTIVRECARTHAQNEIAGVEHVSDITMDPFKTRLITHAAMSVTRDFVSDGCATDAWDRRLARWIDIGHNNAVCVIKGVSKFMTQRFGSRKTMWLKHR